MGLKDWAATLPRLLACPRCFNTLSEGDSPDSLSCPVDGLTFTRHGDIWDLIDPDRRGALEPFVSHYQTVRRLEGWGSDDPGYYRDLPFRDRTGRFSKIWRIKARSFRYLKSLLGQLKRPDGAPPRILDIGAGNGWLSYRLTEMGFAVCAIDLSGDRTDGLGAAIHYPLSFPRIMAEFERWPFIENAFDAAVFAASFHYASDDEGAIGAVARSICHEGRIYIVDTPIYRSAESGRKMVDEMRENMADKYGLETWVQPGPGYLTFERIREWSSKLGYKVWLHRPPYGIRLRFRPIFARILGRREPARFGIIELIK